MKVLEVKQAFPLPPNDEDYMYDLFERVEPATNAILAKVNVDKILHARLDPWSVGRINSTSHD